MCVYRCKLQSNMFLFVCRIHVERMSPTRKKFARNGYAIYSNNRDFSTRDMEMLRRKWDNLEQATARIRATVQHPGICCFSKGISDQTPARTARHEGRSDESCVFRGTNMCFEEINFFRKTSRILLKEINLANL